MAGGIPLGPYVLTERIATGGMGEVYLALRKGLGRFEKPLAIKLLLPHLADDAQAVQLFVEEAQLSARMSHPNIAQVFDVGVIDRRYYLAMELVRGVSLSRLLSALKATSRQLAPPVLTYLGRCLCDALHHAHELKDSGAPLEVVHRDVTPHNVLVSVDGEVKLTDFGIAKARDSSHSTQPGFIKGKLGYIAPEQARGQPLDRRADIYSAGITLFHLCSGFVPFLRDGDLPTLEAVIHEPLPSLAALRPDLPPALVSAVERATQKTASERFATARDLRDALPLPSHQQCAEQLGALVRELCPEDMRALEEKTASALSIVEGTLEVGGASAPQAATVGMGPRPPSRAAAYAFAGALLVASSVTTWWWLSRAQPVPVVAVVTPPVAVDAGPPSVVVVEPPPAPAPPVVVRPAATVKKTGFLTVDAEPWADVYFQNRLIGQTPISKYPLTTGSVQLVLKNPETGRTVKRRIVVSPGVESKVTENMR